LELAWFKYEKDDVDRVQYQGQLRGRSKAGLGCMQGRDGVRYEGHWQNNQRAGLGVEHTSDGIYEGQFKEDMRHGLGVFNKKNGAVYTGEWERGDWHGDGLVKQNTRTGEKETFVHWSFGFAISQGLTSLPLVLTRVAQVQKEAVRVAATAREMAEDARAQCEPEEPACLKARADFKYEEKVRVVEEGVVAAARKMQLEEKAKLTSKSS